MKKTSFKKKIQYRMDLLMEKGTATMIIMLLLFTLLASCVIGIIVAVFSGGAPGERIWDSLMHTLDGGTLAGDALDDTVNVFFMTVMTVIGLCVTSVLIGIINNSFEQKLYNLRKGTSKVMEKGHVVVLGYHYTLFALLESLVEANENHSHQCIVVVGDEDNEVMMDAIKAHISDFHTTKIICRSGKTYEDHMLDRASVENAKSVIINCRSDIQAIKALLAFTAYVKDKELYNPNLYVSVVIQDKKLVNAAKIAGGDRVEVIYGKDAISRIVAHSCNQRGLCSVFEELISYTGNELYCEKVEQVVGMKFHDVLHSFEAEIPIGIYNEKEVFINPDMDTVIQAGDELILLEEDDSSYKISDCRYEIEEDKIVKEASMDITMMDLIVLGQNDRLNDILMEYDLIADKNAIVKIVDVADAIAYSLSEYQNIEIEYVHVNDFSLESLRAVLDGSAFNVLILTNDDIGYEDADAESMVKLIELNKIADDMNVRFSTTCEIRKSANQKLAEIIGAENFVVSSNIAALLATQISENRVLARVFGELLSIEGSELYMKPIERFVVTDQSVSFDTVIESAARKKCIALGFRKVDPKTKNAVIITCPRRDERFTFSKGDTLIVLAAY